MIFFGSIALTFCATAVGGSISQIVNNGASPIRILALVVGSAGVLVAIGFAWTVREDY